MTINEKINFEIQLLEEKIERLIAGRKNNEKNHIKILELRRKLSTLKLINAIIAINNNPDLVELEFVDNTECNISFKMIEDRKNHFKIYVVYNGSLVLTVDNNKQILNDIVTSCSFPVGTENQTKELMNYLLNVGQCNLSNIDIFGLRMNVLLLNKISEDLGKEASEKDQNLRMIKENF